MVWLEQKKNGAFHVFFHIGDEKDRLSRKTNQHKEARGRRLRIEENLKLVESGRLSIPPDGDFVSFLLSDGRPVRPQLRSGYAITPLRPDGLTSTINECQFKC